MPKTLWERHIHLSIAELAASLLAFCCAGELKHALAGDTADILPLHGSLPPAQQAAVFRHYGRGRRKIVLATNVAETSVTISDITVVIDTGRMKEMQYDATGGVAKLADVWVSQASARQRRGRAGRVRCTCCILSRWLCQIRIYTKL